MPANDFAQRYFELSNQDPYIQSVKRPGQTLVKKMSFIYNAVIGSATQPLTFANGPITSNLITLADSDFVLTSLSACMNLVVNGDMKVNRNLTLQIQDTSNGKFFFSQPTVTTLIAGAGGFPFVYPAPRVIRPNTTLLLTAQNRDSANDYFQMFVAFQGTRMFYASN
jgi:hypothetical protein